MLHRDFFDWPTHMQIDLIQATTKLVPFTLLTKYKTWEQVVSIKHVTALHEKHTQPNGAMKKYDLVITE